MELTDDAKTIDLHVEATSRLVEALAAAESRMQRRINLLSEVVFEVDQAHLIGAIGDGHVVAGRSGATGEQEWQRGQCGHADAGIMVQ